MKSQKGFLRVFLPLFSIAGFIYLSYSVFDGLTSEAFHSQSSKHESDKEDHEEMGVAAQQQFRENLLAPFTEDEAAAYRNEYFKNHSAGDMLSDNGTDNSTSWVSLGPKGIFPDTTTQFVLSGRVISLAMDQTNNDIIYLGSASGGLWKSTNRGVSWFQLLDTLTNPTVASIAIEPNNHNNIWIGTSSMYNGHNGFNARILRSTDAGATWSQFPVGGLARLPANLRGIHKIAIDYPRNQFVYAATDNGLYRTTDSGANWSLKLPGYFTDVLVSSGISDPNAVVLAAARGLGLSRSTNNGNNFGAFTTLGFPGGQVGRISLTHHNLYPVINQVYCIAEDAFGGGSMLFIARSQDTGNSWLYTNIPAGNGPRGDYSNCIMMNPKNPDSLLVGWQNRESFRSIDGGQNWLLSSTIHDDYQCFAVSLTDPGLIFSGNDGGVFKSTNFGGQWLNAGNEFLTISQIYYLTRHPTNPQGEWAGLQDNGIISGHDGTFGWFAQACCDGGDISFKGDIPHINIAGLTDGSGNFTPFSWQRKVNGSSQDFTSGITPIGPVRIPPGDFIYLNSRFYTFHNDTVYRTSASGELPWSPLAGSPVSNSMQVFRICPTPEGYLYAAINDTANPLRIYAPGTDSWYSPSGSTLNGRLVTGFSMGGYFNGNRIMYLTQSGITGNRVFKSIDYGLSWLNITSNLPAILNFSSIRAVDDKLIFAGSDFGLFATTTAGASWFDYSSNLPSTPWVTDIEYRNYAFPELLIGTYGRGIWSRDISDLVVSDFKIFTGKLNKNWSDGINWVPSKPIAGEKALIAASCTLDENLPLLNSLEIVSGDTLNMETYALPDIPNIINGGTIMTKNITGQPIPANRLWGGEIKFASNQTQYIPPGIYNRLSSEGFTRIVTGDITVAGRLSIDGNSDTVKMGTFRLNGPLAETNEFWSESVLETQNISADPLPSYVHWNFKVLFSASNNQYIPAGVYNRIIVKNGFIKNLTGDVRVFGSVELAGAVIALNEHNLTLFSLSDFTPSSFPYSSFNMIRTNQTGKLRKVVFDHSSWYPQFFPVGFISYNPVTLNMSGPFTTDTFSVKVTNTIDPPPYNPNQVINAMWTISEDNAGGTNASITVRYNEGQFSSGFNNTAGSVYLARHNGSSWVPTQVSGIIDIGGGEFEATAEGFTGFSPFAIGNAEALPVQLLEFTYTASKNDVKILWTTLVEMNNAGFDIERRMPGDNVWKRLGNVTGHGTTKEPVSYSFTDRKLPTGKYLYRLKQIDFNGNHEYFSLPGEVDVGKPKEYSISQNYPNPFNPLTKIDFDIPLDGKVTLKIYDVTGREVFILVNNEFRIAGYYTAEFDAGYLASGIYFYRIVCENYTKVKKMVLIK